MIFRLILFLAIPMIGAFFGARTIYRAWKKSLAGREHALKQLGAYNARLKCVFCEKPVDPNNAFYEERLGWHHSECLRKEFNS
jgi:hypothetical protein